MKFKKALLINPPTGIYDRENRCQAPVSNETIRLIRPPLDLTYMAAVLEQAGAACVIRDYPASGNDWEAFSSDIDNHKPDLLVISATTPTFKDDMRAAQVARQKDPSICTIIKGGHILTFARSILKDYPYIDIAIRSECEFAIKDIALNDDLNLVPGITWRCSDKIVENPMPEDFGDLNNLPFPARHLIDNSLYLSPDNNRPIAMILTNRGCPNQCIYCLSHVISGSVIRQRAVQSIVAEIEECVGRYGIRDFFFRADTFTYNKQWLLELCSLITKKGLNIRWGTNSRVNTIDEERLAAMKMAGCDIIGFGVESGDQDMLNKIKKNITLDQAVAAVKLCRKFKMKTYLFFMVGFPWDTKESIKKTIDFAVSLDADFYNFFIAYPFPGTELYGICEQNGLFESESLFGHDFFKPVIRTFTLSNAEIAAFEKQAQRRLFFRPHVWLRMLLAHPSPRVWLNFIRTGIAAVKNM